MIQVFSHQNFKTRDDALEFLAAKTEEAGNTSSKKKVFEAFVARENLGSTGMMNGFAIPHAKSATITRPEIYLLKLDTPIAWESMDGEPIEILIALLIPEAQAGTTHLKMLSTLARLLMKSDFREEVRQQQDEAKLKKYLEEIIISES